MFVFDHAMWIEIHAEDLDFWRNRHRPWIRYDMRRQYFTPRNVDGFCRLLDRHFTRQEDLDRHECYWIVDPTMDTSAWQVLRAATGSYLDDLIEPPGEFGDDGDLRVVLPYEPEDEEAWDGED